jgi:hypothetical protein
MLNQVQHPLATWVFIISITDEFILGLYVLHIHDASMDLVHHRLQMGDEEVRPCSFPNIKR